MSEQTSFAPDPDRYARCARVHASRVELDAALKRFHEGVAALREECGIRDLLFLVSAEYADVGGTPVECAAPGFYGNQLHALPMAAYLHGHEERALARHISMLKQGVSP